MFVIPSLKITPQYRWVFLLGVSLCSLMMKSGSKPRANYSEGAGDSDGDCAGCHPPVSRGIRSLGHWHAQFLARIHQNPPRNKSKPTGSSLIRLKSRLRWLLRAKLEETFGKQDRKLAPTLLFLISDKVELRRRPSCASEALCAAAGTPRLYLWTRSMVKAQQTSLKAALPMLQELSWPLNFL